jgi:hypothetical protein
MKATSASIFSLVGQPLFNFAVGDIAPKRTWISWPKWKVKAKLAGRPPNSTPRKLSLSYPLL